MVAGLEALATPYLWCTGGRPKTVFRPMFSTSAKPGTHYRYYGPLQTTTDHYEPLYCLWSGPGFADATVTSPTIPLFS